MTLRLFNKILVWFLVLLISGLGNIVIADLALAAEIFFSKGDFGPVGVDNSTCGAIGTPCLTPSWGLERLQAVVGGQPNGADSFLTGRGGEYDTVYGLKKITDNRFTGILSGTPGHPFTIRAYNSNSPGTGCDASPPAPGQSACEPVTFVRAFNNSVVSLAQMQSQGGPGCGGKACVGSPDFAECAAFFQFYDPNHTGYPFGDPAHYAAYNPPVWTFTGPGSVYSTAGYPGNCLSGGPGLYGLYIMTDRSGALMFEAVVDLYGLQDSNPVNEVHDVVFDGITIDARGVQVSAFRSSQWNDHVVAAQFFTWQNSTWKNSTASMTAQPGIANGVDGGTTNNGWCIGIPYDFTVIVDFNAHTCVQGPKIRNNFVWRNMILRDGGIPFDTLRTDQTNVGVTSSSAPLIRQSEGAKYLHGLYAHAGYNSLINSEVTNIAGFGVAFSDEENFAYRNYIHDNNGGLQCGGSHHTFYNNVLYNNGNTDLQCNSIGNFNVSAGSAGNNQRDWFYNNTFVAGPRSVSSIAVQFGAGLNGSLFQSNIISGYRVGIDAGGGGAPCGASGGSCLYTNRNAISNNVISAVTPFGLLSGTDGVTVMLPACTIDGGAGNMASCNKINPPAGVGFFSTNAPNFTLASNSVAVDYTPLNALQTPLTTDFLGNTRPFNSISDSGAFEYCVGGGCTAVATTGTISVFSSGASGVSIAFSGCNNPSVSSPQNTNFNLVCDLGSNVTLTALATASSQNFTTWTGCDSVNGLVCSLHLTGGRTLSAGYGLTQTLQVNSTVASTVLMAISPSDVAGNGNGTTNLSRAFNKDQNVIITAPSQSGNKFFGSWTGCTSTSGTGGIVCSVTMSTDKTVSATYDGAGCGFEKAFVTGSAVEICPPSQSITIYDNFTIDGQPVGSHVTGDKGVIIGGPGDFEGTPYYKVNWETAPLTGWLTSVNIKLSTGVVIPPTVTGVKVGAGTKAGASIKIGQ